MVDRTPYLCHCSNLNSSTSGSSNIIFYNSSCRFTQHVTPFASSRRWNSASEKAPFSRELATFKTQSSSIMENYLELDGTSGNLRRQTSFSDDIARSSGQHRYLLLQDNSPDSKKFSKLTGYLEREGLPQQKGNKWIIPSP